MFTLAEKLPALWTLAQKTSAGLRGQKFSDWGPLIEHIRPILEPDFIDSVAAVVPGWRKVSTLHNGQTALHTTLVLSLCLYLPEYTLADPQTQWELEWAALLHDIDKEGARGDPTHPFRSAAVAAPLLPALGFDPQPGITPEDLDAWAALVLTAQRLDGERMLHDHTPLPAIIADLHRCWGQGTPASRVLKAILFHQSLPTVNDWPNPVLLTDAELAYALTLQDMDVLGPLMVADSDSWNIFEDNRTRYLYELRANNAQTRARIASQQP